MQRNKINPKYGFSLSYRVCLLGERKMLRATSVFSEVIFDFCSVVQSSSLCRIMSNGGQAPKLFGASLLINLVWASTE